jgi:hypothetical protein
MRPTAGYHELSITSPSPAAHPLVVTRLRVFSQAKYARAALKAAHVGVHSTVTVVATCPLGCAVTSCRSVVMIAHRVTVEPGPFPPRHVSSSLETRAAATAFGSTTAPPAAAIVSGAVVLAAIGLATRLLVESGPPLQHIRPSFLCLPEREGRVSGQRPPGVLPEEGVDVVRQDSEKRNDIN